jgi:hypothetical protein
MQRSRVEGLYMQPAGNYEIEEGRVLRVTVSGSFRRHMAAIYETVGAFMERGVSVLSPADPRIVDQIGEFVFVASDRVRSIKMVEDRHLECIGISDFLWLVAPDGYVGQSASMELGYAIARDVPIFSEDLPNDGTLRKYVQHVPSVAAALPLAYASRRKLGSHSPFVVDPIAAIDLAQSRLESMRGSLTHPAVRIGDVEGETVLEQASDLAAVFSAAPHSARCCKATD